MTVVLQTWRMKRFKLDQLQYFIFQHQVLIRCFQSYFTYVTNIDHFESQYFIISLNPGTFVLDPNPERRFTSFQCKTIDIVYMASFPLLFFATYKITIEKVMCFYDYALVTSGKQVDCIIFKMVNNQPTSADRWFHISCSSQIHHKQLFVCNQKCCLFSQYDGQFDLVSLLKNPSTLRDTGGAFSWVSSLPTPPVTHQKKKVDQKQQTNHFVETFSSEEKTDKNEFIQRFTINESPYLKHPLSSGRRYHSNVQTGSRHIYDIDYRMNEDTDRSYSIKYRHQQYDDDDAITNMKEQRRKLTWYHNFEMDAFWMFIHWLNFDLVRVCHGWCDINFLWQPSNRCVIYLPGYDDDYYYHSSSQTFLWKQKHVWYLTTLPNRKNVIYSFLCGLS